MASENSCGQWILEASWGRVLDAGAGINLTSWLLRQSYDTVTGVTARPVGLDSYGNALHSFADDSVNIVVGNWKDKAFTKETNQYDIVLSDYLLGSTELHWMYGAEMLLELSNDHNRYYKKAYH